MKQIENINTAIFLHKEQDLRLAPITNKSNQVDNTVKNPKSNIIEQTEIGNSLDQDSNQKILKKTLLTKNNKVEFSYEIAKKSYPYLLSLMKKKFK